jgi:hypothetical protein
MDNRIVLVPVRRAGLLLTILTLMIALFVGSLAPVASAQRETPMTSPQVNNPAGDTLEAAGVDAAPPGSCPGNLLQNPSFETVSGSNSWGDPIPLGWTHSGSGFTGATTAYAAPDGNRVGYVVHSKAASTAAIMYQQVAAVPGATYSMTFYSGTHDPSKQPTIALRFYNGSGNEIGTPAIYTITSKLELNGLGGPYTLNGTAPVGVASLRVIFTDPANSTAGAKGDALCLKQAPDYGDAPDTGTDTAQGDYNTTAGDNGPSHVIVANLQLGVNAPDADSGTLQDAAATADDTSNTGSADDEDGVIALPTILTTSTSVALNVSVLNTTGTAAALACWLDFNRDGDFLDAGERASAAVNSSASQQTIALTFSGFVAPTAGTSYLRCRLATAAGEVTNPTGAANTGEVEDYQVTIGATLDYGDAPDTAAGTGVGNYNTLATDSGPSHDIAPGVYLGAGVDPDNGSLQNITATADDSRNTGLADDEDGVVFQTPLAAGKPARIQVTASVAGCLNAWVDYNGNGLFTDTGEQIATNLTVVAGANALNVTSPGTARGVLYSRFRFTQQCGQGGQNPTGPASSGEVEDYALAALGDYVWVDSNRNGVQDDGNTGLNGVTVKLLDSTGNPVLDSNNDPITTATANTPDGGQPGWYEFQGLPAGNFFVQFVTDDYAFTAPYQGGDMTADSDANLNTGTTGVVRLAPGQVNPTLDAGLVGNGPTAVRLASFSGHSSALLLSSVTLATAGMLAWGMRRR